MSNFLELTSGDYINLDVVTFFLWDEEKHLFRLQTKSGSEYFAYKTNVEGLSKIYVSASSEAIIMTYPTDRRVEKVEDIYCERVTVLAWEIEAGFVMPVFVEELSSNQKFLICEPQSFVELGVRSFSDLEAAKTQTVLDLQRAWDHK